MKVSNQKPVVLTPNYSDVISKPFDPKELTKTTMVAPLYTPVTANNPVKITGNGHTISQDDITDQLINACGDTFNGTAEAFMKELFHETLLYYNHKTSIGIDECFVVQAGTKVRLQEPSDVVIYTPTQDVIPTCRQFLAGQCDYEMFFASLAYYARPHTLGFYFANDVVFNDFKTWLNNQMTTLSSILPQQTIDLMADFQTISLNDLTETIQLRNDDANGNDPYSFPRTIISQLMLYAQQISTSEFGLLPFSVAELFCPKTITFVNVEKHAKATSRQVADEWKMVNQSIQNKPQMISQKKLNKLTAAQRNLQKIASAAVSAANNAGAPVGKSAVFRFSKTRPTTMDIMKLIKQILAKKAFVNRSMNLCKQVRTSYSRPNRRDPDDYNKPGKSTAIRYKPDIHLYIDTSGSISERDYEDAVKSCIKLARKLNINLYFNSFSHVLSQTTKLNLENKSNAQVYKEFQKVPKVDGGTDYEQIWHFINSSKKRTDEISILITDFEYTAPSSFIKHPKSLYYIPCSTLNYDNIKYWAEQFAKSMVHNDPAIRKHILF